MKYCFFILFFEKYISILNLILKNLKSFCGKKDPFDCAGIRAQDFVDQNEQIMWFYYTQLYKLIFVVNLGCK